ncbi:DUF4833 domain-containing protein [Aestuariivirga sp.]|uniref:DUF4833 domain-containing protein n=1 Tax=Aestuariivirga sp. TaxID=2650926 RepID=UPI003BA9E149
MNRRRVILGCAALVMGTPAARGDQPSGSTPYAVPHDENQIFFVQRSMNSNTIVYTARMGADGHLDPKKPVDVFWRRFNDQGERQELSFLERNIAFGVKAQRLSGPPAPSFCLQVVSYPQRSAVLRLVNGRPRLEAKVAGEPCVLDHAFLHLDESGAMPKVTRVDLAGHSLASGVEVRESFKP